MPLFIKRQGSDVHMPYTIPFDGNKTCGYGEEVLDIKVRLSEGVNVLLTVYPPLAPLGYTRRVLSRRFFY